jgi:hypothetical protein
MLVAPIVFSLAGCGTVCNLACLHARQDGTVAKGPPEVYGGVDNDAELWREGLHDMNLQGPHGALFALCVLAEFPVTLCADTLTLPVTLTIQQICNSKDRIPEATRQELGKLPAEGGYGAVIRPPQPADSAAPGS